MNNIGAGSLLLGMTLSGGSGYSDPNAASSSITNSFSGAALDGVSVGSVSATATGFTTPTTTDNDSGPNLGLILGLTIPLCLLCTLLSIQ